jgi:hypothetical protein
MLQQYIDNTNDLQSVVLLSCSIGMMDSPTIHGSTRGVTQFQQWIQLYRDLLNRHQLWLERAKFDVARAKKLKQLEKDEQRRLASSKGTASSNNAATFKSVHSAAATIGTAGTSGTSSATKSTPKLSESEKDAVLFIQRPQVAARCNHCKASFQLSDLLSDASIRRSDWLAKQPAKMLSCPLPKCKKALPRCSICLLPMTVQNPFLYLQQKKNGQQEQNSSKKRGKQGTSWEGTNPYNDWFVWCQTCHHGGHTACLSDWFNRHPKCPVSNCTCVCSSLDVTKK